MEYITIIQRHILSDSGNKYPFYSNMFSIFSLLFWSDTVCLQIPVDNKCMRESYSDGNQSIFILEPHWFWLSENLCTISGTEKPLFEIWCLADWPWDLENSWADAASYMPTAMSTNIIDDNNGNVDWINIRYVIYIVRCTWNWKYLENVELYP